jgi:eukaryotic-like serine/threonine-protein kinase
MAAADHHLLFGLIALQVGLIDQSQLVAAFQAWARDKSRPLSDHLADRGGLDPDVRAAVEAMVALHVKKHGGDTEKSLASIPAGRSTRERLAALGDAELNGTVARLGSAPTDPEVGGDDPDRTATLSVGTATSDGQRFRVLRPHARGGLGAVFVALDGELHREVALKQILDHHADDPTSRSRFLLEAEITGGLEHPGIVPVYGLGSYGDGRPYYAMRFIRGDSLKEAVERFHRDEGLKRDTGRRSLELRKLLRRFLDICNAIDYAHSRGVLHRDIKPGNVIIGKHGETLVVDWGLAKAVGRADFDPTSAERPLTPSSASGSAETLPGSALGTPAFMSPEQARGDLDALGAHSDVYSLGATLYCLLTGQAPFEGDVGEVLRRVQAGDFPPPRRVDPTIDRALEAVCLKAMALDPRDRYASCRALADDVERWTADEPVTAWREPLGRRARRWAKRNRTAVTGAAVALVAGVVGLSAVLAVQTKAKAEIERSLANETRANTALAAANSELTRSQVAVQDRYVLAVDAIKAFHTGVSEDFLLKEEKFKELRDRLLKSASDFYGKLGALLGKETDFASRRALAQANFDVADLTDKVGRPEDALAAHRAVLARREVLMADPASDIETKSDVGRSLTAVAILLESTGKTAEAEATYRKTEALLADLARSSPSSPAVRAALALCRSRLAYLLYTMGKSADALAAYRLARADQEGPAAAPGATNEARRDLVETIHRIGILMANTGRPTEAEAEYRMARALSQKLADDNPAITDFRRRLAGIHHNLGIVLSQTGKPAEAEAEYRKAVALNQKLADDNPAVVKFRSDLAGGQLVLGNLLLQTGKPTEAEAEFRKAVAIPQKLADDNPAVTEFRSRLADSHNGLGVLLWNTGKSREAEAEYHKALAIQQKLADDNPAVTDFRSTLALSHNTLGTLLSQTGKPTEAEAEYRKAIALQRKLADDNPAVTHFRDKLALSHYNLGWQLSQSGKPTEAEAEYRTAIVLQQKLADDNPAVTDFRSTLALSHNTLGWQLAQTGKPTQAEAEFRTALVLQQKLADDNPAVTDFRSRLADSHISLGWMLSGTGKPTEAEAEFRKALTIRKKLADDNPAVAQFRSYVADSHSSLGSVLSETGKPSEADAEYRTALAIQQKLADDNPAVTRFRGRLANSRIDLGILLSQAGKPTEAEAEYRTALAIYQKLAEDEPRVPEHRRGKTKCLNNIGDLRTDAGQLSEAIEVYERARPILDALVKDAPTVDDYRSGLAFNLSGLGRARRRAGDRAAAVTDLRRAIALREGLASLALESRYDLACNHALLAALAIEPGSGLPIAEGGAEAERVMAILKRLVAEGYRNAKTSTDPDFDSLRNRRDFRLLMLDLAMPADPFARTP